MSTNNQKKEILQIITKLKVCPSPQGGLFLFLVTILILENFEKQKFLELINSILKKNNLSFLEKEWEILMIILSILLQKIRSLSSEKISRFLKISKNIPPFLREIYEVDTLNIKDLTTFLNKNSVTSLRKVQKENLKKMFASNLHKLSRVNNHKKIEKENLSKKKFKNQ